MATNGNQISLDTTAKSCEKYSNISTTKTSTKKQMPRSILSLKSTGNGSNISSRSTRSSRSTASFKDTKSKLVDIKDANDETLSDTTAKTYTNQSSLLPRKKSTYVEIPTRSMRSSKTSRATGSNNRGINNDLKPTKGSRSVDTLRASTARAKLRPVDKNDDKDIDDNDEIQLDTSSTSYRRYARI